MKIKSKSIDISSLAPFFLFTCFSVCVLSVLMIGANLYRTQADRDLTDYQKRTVSQYITTRIHQSDSYDACFVGDFETATPQSTGNAFFYTETIDGEQYYTCMYCHDGYLYELFAAADVPPDFSAGEPILQIESLYFIDDGRSIHAMITHMDGIQQKTVVNLRCSGEKLP